MNEVSPAVSSIEEVQLLGVVLMSLSTGVYIMTVEGSEKSL